MTKIVKKGNTGELVYQLQEKLAKVGYAIKPDGSFGPATETALKAYQTKSNLVPDGIAGPNTLKSLGITEITKAQLAASFASRNVEPRSVGLCARYVANALEAAWYHVKRQPSAYLYSEKLMAEMGFTRLSNSTTPRVGDIIVIERTEKRKHGHIQIFDGRNWISDFRQRTISPYTEAIPFHFYRDLTNK